MENKITKEYMKNSDNSISIVYSSLNKKALRKIYKFLQQDADFDIIKYISISYYRNDYKREMDDILIVIPPYVNLATYNKSLMYIEQIITNTFINNLLEN